MTTTEIDDGASDLRCRARLVGIHRHRQGPRVYLLGRRIHEYMLGAAIFALVVAGWYVTEVGRQPWIVYGVMKTADQVTSSPGMDSASAGIDLSKP